MKADASPPTAEDIVVAAREWSADVDDPTPRLADAERRLEAWRRSLPDRDAAAGPADVCS